MSFVSTYPTNTAKLTTKRVVPIIVAPIARVPCIIHVTKYVPPQGGYWYAPQGP